MSWRHRVVVRAVIGLALSATLSARVFQSPGALIAGADKKFQAGDLAGAIADYTKAIALDPKNASAFTARGFIRIHAGQTDEAIADFTSAFARDAAAAANYGFRGYLKNVKGDLDGAIGDERQAIALNSKTLLAYKTLVEVHFAKAYRCPALTDPQKREQLALGLEAADRALALDAEARDILMYKGLLLRVQANLESDSAKQRSLLGQADALRTKAQEIKDVSPSPLPPVPTDRSINCGVAPPVMAGATVPLPKKIKDVLPVYPAIAQAARVQGIVTVEVTIGLDGKVSAARIVQSIPLLDQAALEAARQWEFERPSVNGIPTPVAASFLVTFTLK